MKPISEEDRGCPNEISPLKQMPENPSESGLKNTLEILVASGKVTEEDVLCAWKLGFVA